MATGIIAEYNPFHAGHAYQLAQIKKLSDAEIVAVMSGHFTQRGEPTILDKWTRARLAVANGVDLVLELPFTSAVRSAQDFARGGIRLLESLGVVDTLAFGAEFADLSTLQRAAKTFDEEFFSDELHCLMSSGMSYAAAVTQILANATALDEKILRQPNTILAIEYLRALPETISPLPIERHGGRFKSDGTVDAPQCCDNSNVVAATKCSPARFIAAHNDSTLHETFSSALAIRNAVRQPSPQWQKISAQVPAETLTALHCEHATGFVDEEFLFRPLMTKLLTSTVADLRKIYGMKGIEFKLLNAASTAKNFSELVSLTVNRQFTASRVRRLLLFTLLDVTDELIAETDKATVARVLAFNLRGQKLLKRISAASTTPVVTKLTKFLNRRDVTERSRPLTPAQKILLLDVLATNLRELLFKPPRQPYKDFTMSPVRL